MVIDYIVILKWKENYTFFHLRDGKAKMYAYCIRSYEHILRAKGFSCVHKLFMINPLYLLNYSNDEN